jgi:hypothetical protein
MADTSYDYLLTILDRVHGDLVEAARVGHELMRDGMLTSECRLLRERAGEIAYTIRLVKVAREVRWARWRV